MRKISFPSLSAVKTLLPRANQPIWGGLLFQIAWINNRAVVVAYNNKTLV